MFSYLLKLDKIIDLLFISSIKNISDFYLNKTERRIKSKNELFVCLLC